jgi:anthranilate phosphoribosyltransferase
MIRESIQKLVEGNNLSYDESAQAMKEIMTGEATNAQTGAFLTALRMKGESVEEIIAFATVMRNHCLQIHPKVQSRLVDTCGTGGDKIKTFNVSTAAAFVIAGSGIAVAKHGNRAVTSKSGSADVLEKLGLNLNLQPQAVQEIIEKVGVGFMFAPAFHPAMKFAAQTRKEIGVRTVFNVLGPLTNPACANSQLLGVYEPKLVSSLANALNKLGCEEAMVVHGLDGLDEISTVGKSLIARLRNSEVDEFEVSPKYFGVKKAEIADLKVSTADESAETIFRILCGSEVADAKVEMVLVNSAAGIIVGGKAEDFKEAIQVAKESINSGAAYTKLKALIAASGGSLQKLEELEAKYE